MEAHAEALAVTVAFAATCAGAVMVTLAVPVHPWLSVTVRVYVLALNALMLDVVAELLHE